MSPVAELKTILREKNSQIQAFLDNGIKIDGNNVEVKSEDKAKIQTILAEAREIKSLLDMHKFGVDTGRLLDFKDSDGSKAVEAMAGGYIRNMGTKSLGLQFVESKEFQEAKENSDGIMRSPFSIEAHDITGGRLQRKDIYGDLSSHAIDLGVGTVVQFDPMVPRQQRATRVRDLFPVATTSANLIDYFRVTGFVEQQGKGNAQTVPERSGGTFGLKPQSNLVFESDGAPVRTIAHWEAIHRNVVQDVPQLMATVNNELLYGLALVEDDQILNGDGSGNNLRGLMNTNGVQLYPAATNELRSDSLRKATTLAVLANYAPTGYVLHPNDWETLELQKGSGDGQYMLVTNIAIGVNAQVWRQPVVETPAMTEGQFINGAWGIGAQLYDRQQANVRIAEQHADFFLRNAVVILCEERLALTVKRPESFVIGTFG